LITKDFAMPASRPQCLCCRADHIGSLLRPSALKNAFRAKARNELTDSQFTRIQDDSIRSVVQLQEQVGMPVVNDGEYRRGSYWSRFVERTEGLTIKDASFRFRDDQGNETDFTAPYAAGKVSRKGAITVDEFKFVKSLTKSIIKVTMPAPSTMHLYRVNDWADPKAYVDAKQFFSDLGKVYQQEIAELAQAGCNYVQIDEVALAMLCDPKVRERVSALGADPSALVDLYVDAINEAVSNRPAGMYMGVHMCRGNFKGRYLSDGGYDDVAEKLFGKANVTHFLLEYDTARAGDFAPLRYMPKNKGVVLGLISSKTAQLESLDDLARRAEQAARFVDADRLGISPQCGFASTVAGNPITEDDMRAKLELVVKAADRICA
jgi:5-methyltetrahydropteroyltriglutamate--homocysteine methyltransferase